MEKKNHSREQKTGVVLLALLALVFLPAYTGAEGVARTAAETAVQDETATEEFGDEIMVTARRREENVQKIPISITTFDDTAIQERSMKDLSDISKATPNVSFTPGPFGNSSAEGAVVIRGIGQIDTAIFADPAVGLYVDGVFLSRAQGGILDLLELERVEVLRGPQGTLFGKNTTGGALSLVTRKPSNAFGGRLSGTVGDLDRRDLQGSVSGALGEKLWGSAAVLSTNRDGYGRSLQTGQEFYDDNRDAARLALRLQPQENLTIDLVGDFTREDESGSNQILLSLTETDLLQFYNRARVTAGLLPVTEELWRTDSFYDSHATAPSYVEGDVYGTAFTLNYLASSSFGFQSISAWRGFDFDTAGDADTTPTQVAEVVGGQQHDQFSQELQFSGVAKSDRLDWVVGALYFRERPRSTADAEILGDLFEALEAAPGPIFSPPGLPDFLCVPGPPPPGVPCFGGAGNPANAFFLGFSGTTFIDLETESWAVFGEATYSVNDRLSATLGARYSRDDKAFDYLSLNKFGNVVSDLFAAGDWDALTPRFSLAYQAKPEVLLYFTASNGYKSGGFNGRPQNRPELDPYDPEEVWSYEVGIKSDLLERRLRLNAATFFSDYTDIQFGASLDVNGMPVFVTQNAGNAEISGFELELNAYPTTGLMLSAGLGYTDTELTDLDPRVPAGLREGGTLPKTPEWTANGTVQYTFNLNERGAVIARVDYSYRGEEQNDIANSPGIVQEAFDLVNARLLYAPVSDRFEVAAFVTNLTDEEYIANGFFASAFGFNIGTAGRPREWGLTFQWRF